MNRRTLLNTAFTGVLGASASGLAVAAESQSSPSPASPPGGKTVDCNVSLFHWPFRRLPYDDPKALVEKLRSLQIAEAWAGSFEGVLHRDLDSANARLAAACREHGQGLLRPFGSVNPALPDWEEDLRRCAEVHRMNGIRLHPNYHGYALALPAFDRLLALAGAAGLMVQLAASLEDTRTQHPLMQVADVDLKPLPALMQKHPRTRLMLLNHRPTAATAALAKAPNISFDIARTEGTDGVARLVMMAGADRVTFGSHAPFLIPEAALIRLEEAGLSESEARAVLHENAARCLAA